MLISFLLFSMGLYEVLINNLVNDHIGKHNKHCQNDDNKNYVKTSIDLIISHAKSKRIKRINKHQFYSLDLVKVSNKYHVLINYVNGNL